MKTCISSFSEKSEGLPPGLPPLLRIQARAHQSPAPPRLPPTGGSGRVCSQLSVAEPHTSAFSLLGGQPEPVTSEFLLQTTALYMVINT